MSVLDRGALEQSPLADLHALASDLSIDGYRRLRREELIDAILGRQGESGEADEASAADETPETSEREEPVEQEALTEIVADELRIHDEETPSRRRRTRRGGRGRGPARERDQESRAEQDDGAEEEPDQPAEEPEEDQGPEETVEGTVELLPNGSGFIRVSPPEPSDDDVYISAAQVKRCELVSGDQISGPRRKPRRSERFASLVRVDAINGRPAAEVAGGARFDDLPAAFPAERFKLGSEDPTLKAIEWLTPFGRGSRVSIVGPTRSGKTEALRRLATTLAALEDVQLSLVLVGVRPEEISEWARGPIEPAVALSFAVSPEVQGQTLERLVDQARRVAARGGNAVVLIDTLETINPVLARRALAAARNIVDGGSLTIVATAPRPLGGETTVIALDPTLASSGRYPALDLVASGTIRPELLVGEAGAEAIARARADTLEEE